MSFFYDDEYLPLDRNRESGNRNRQNGRNNTKQRGKDNKGQRGNDNNSPL